jgi:hypothetical protein
MKKLLGKIQKVINKFKTWIIIPSKDFMKKSIG